MKTCIECKHYFDVVFLDGNDPGDVIELPDDYEQPSNRVSKCLVLEKMVPIGVSPDEKGRPIIQYCSMFEDRNVVERKPEPDPPKQEKPVAKKNNSGNSKKAASKQSDDEEIDDGNQAE